MSGAEVMVEARSVMGVDCSVMGGDACSVMAERVAKLASIPDSSDLAEARMLAKYEMDAIGPETPS